MNINIFLDILIFIGASANIIIAISESNPNAFFGWASCFVLNIIIARHDYFKSKDVILGNDEVEQ